MIYGVHRHRKDQPTFVRAANFIQREVRSASHFSRDETDQCSTTDFVGTKKEQRCIITGIALIEREGLLRSSMRETRNNATFQAEEKEAATHLRRDPGYCFDEQSHGIQHPLFSRSQSILSILVPLSFSCSKYVIGNGELQERRRY